jgi:hypothetical protein
MKGEIFQGNLGRLSVIRRVFIERRRKSSSCKRCSNVKVQVKVRPLLEGATSQGPWAAFGRWDGLHSALLSPEGTQACQQLDLRTSDFQNWNDMYVLFLATELVASCYSSHRKLTHSLRLDCSGYHHAHPASISVIFLLSFPVPSQEMFASSMITTK